MYSENVNDDGNNDNKKVNNNHMKTPSKHKNIYKLLTRNRKVLIKRGGSQGWVFKETLFPEDISSIMLRWR